MPLKIDPQLTPRKLLPAIERTWELSAQKILAIEKTWKPADGTPVFTEGPIHLARLDGVDAGLPVRLGDPPVRCDG